MENMDNFRERFEALARSVRDVLTQRWLQTEEVYERENPKRVYYLSMEFLIGRLIEDVAINLRLEDQARAAIEASREAGVGRFLFVSSLLRLLDSSPCSPTPSPSSRPLRAWPFSPSPTTESFFQASIRRRSSARRWRATPPVSLRSPCRTTTARSAS